VTRGSIFSGVSAMIWLEGINDFKPQTGNAAGCDRDRRL